MDSFKSVLQKLKGKEVEVELSNGAVLGVITEVEPDHIVVEHTHNRDIRRWYIKISRIEDILEHVREEC